jgi:hypothetical protein
MKDIPAFPLSFVAHPTEETFIAKGMRLRDYFAAKAMQGMLSENSGIRYPTDELVEFSYKVADAMMKAREE